MRGKKLAMKNIKYIITFGIALIGVMLFTACDNLADTEEIQTPIKNGYGRISISLTGKETAQKPARTVLPSTVFDKYVYTFTKEDEETGTEKTPDNEGFFILEVGNYTVAIQAYIGYEDNYTLAASGVSSLFNVETGNNAPVKVFLFGVDTGEQGKFSYTITYPAGATADITLEKWPDMDNITLTPANLIGKNGINETLELETGSYLLTILISKDEFYAGIIETVHIHSTNVTEYTKDFYNNDLLAFSQITTIEIILTAPVKGAIPDTATNGGVVNSVSNFSIGSVSWSPVNNLFLGDTVYTVTFILTANDRYTFTGLNSASINGQNAVVSNNTGKTVTLSYTFSPTEKRTVTNIAIKTQPTKLIYTHGDLLDLTGLIVTLTYDDTTTEDVSAVNFTAKNITVNPAHGNNVVHSTHNGQSVTITYGGLQPLTTSNLVVSKATGLFSVPAAINTTYTPILTLANLTLPIGYVWNVPATGLNAGNGQLFPATYTDPSGDYETASGNVIVNVAKATGITVNTPVLNIKTHNSITVNPITVSNGQSVEYAASVNSAAPSSGWQTSTTFTGLNMATNYYIFARAAGNSNYETGVASGSLTVTTMQNVAENKFEYYWIDQHGSLVTTSGGVITVVAGETLTITSQGNGYVVKQWHLNGFNTGLSGNTYNFSSKTIGKHVVGLFVEKDGKLYNTNITITVETGITVTFNANSGTGITPASQTIIIGSSITLPSGSELSRSGYTFGGWNTNVSGTGTNYNAETSYTPTDNITLYARWNIISNGTETNPFLLTAGIWENGSITSSASGSAVWYSFNVTSGTTYRVWWNDSYQGNSTKTLDIKVDASYSNGTAIFTGVDSAYTTAQSFTANQTGTVKLKISPYNSGNTGTFGIVYSTNSTRP